MFADLNTHVVEFVVEPAGVAHRVTVPVAPPQSGRGCLAVRAAGASSPRSRLQEKNKKYSILCATLKHPLSKTAM